ncbi:MAG: aspartate carbamoyltransferase [Clostridia bacterium]|nr:aspartate carbamoyltransferase [Clostridia bacterium]
MKTKNVIDLTDLSHQELTDIIKLANEIRERPKEFGDVCKGKILATLFYEPSTRTQMSFQTAMLRLGGSIIGFDNPQNSSVSKGESLKDTITVVGGYADIIAIRHPSEGTAAAASMYSAAPVINAGDGGHLHPTQTLTDVVTLYNEMGRLDHLTIGLCGDLKNGRTVHSLIKTMSTFKGNKFILISTPELSVPQYIKDIINASECDYEEIGSLTEAMPGLDVLYMTRIQRERFASEEEYKKQNGVFVLDKEKLKAARKSMKILHPLPRVDEIDVEVDYDERAKYFEQTVYGMYGRMALIMTMLKNTDRTPDPRVYPTHPFRCSNPNCISRTEKYLPGIFREAGGDMLLCRYCEGRTLI